ncbi:MAG: hypothetical protein VX796_16705 [Pseudomonadota bacterium]|nr:hypothetical protein [Pseudomonadota bacterium]
MKRYALYTDAGEIASIFTGSPESAALQGSRYLECDEGVSDTTHYIREGSICEKARLDVVISVAGLVATLSGIPEGTTVRAQGQLFAVSGEVELEFDRLGRYPVHLMTPPEYVNVAVEVDIDA